jgi:ATP-dependent DNA helicase RecG
MLTAEQVEELLLDLENDRVERTISTNDTDKFSRAVCAFANDMPNHRKPGVLIIGAKDSGEVAGIPITDPLLQKLGGLRSDGNILPLPALQSYKVDLSAGSVAVVEVQPSDSPPVRYKGSVHIRVGPRRAVANEQEERILSERRSRLLATWDLQPVPGASLDELSTRTFGEYRASIVSAEVIEANHRTIKEQLAAFRFFDLQRDLPTVAGLLTVGVNPRFHLPGAYVQFLRFSDESLADLPRDQAEIDGDLDSVARSLHERVAANNPTRLVRSEGFREAQRQDYPPWALRELLHNALMHRDYASTGPIRFYWFRDRIEILNPGGVDGKATTDSLTRSSSYRNPVIAEAMKNLGHVNKFGYGLQRAQALLRENGNPPLEIEADTAYFQVIVRRAGS